MADLSNVSKSFNKALVTSAEDAPPSKPKSAYRPAQAEDASDSQNMRSAKDIDARNKARYDAMDAEAAKARMAQSAQKAPISHLTPESAQDGYSDKAEGAKDADEAYSR